MRLEAVDRVTQLIHEATWQSWAATMTGAQGSRNLASAIVIRPRGADEEQERLLATLQCRALACAAEKCLRPCPGMRDGVALPVRRESVEQRVWAPLAWETLERAVVWRCDETAVAA